MDDKKQWGGTRPHPPGREGGRPKNPYPRQNLVIYCTDEEYQEIISKLKDTRQRAEILLEAARHAV